MESWRKKTPPTGPELFNSTPQNPIVYGQSQVPSDGGTVVSSSSLRDARSRGKKALASSARSV